jgi:hypothetical protein
VRKVINNKNKNKSSPKFTEASSKEETTTINEELVTTTIDEDSTVFDETFSTQNIFEETTIVVAIPSHDFSSTSTIQMDDEEPPVSSEETSTVLDENFPTEISFLLPTTPTKSRTGSNKTKSRTKVSRVMIFKRPILSTRMEESTESMVKINRAEGMESDLSLKALEVALVKIVSMAIASWKTSLLIVLIIVLIISLSYYRGRIIRLKAEIVDKNLGNSHSPPCHPQSSNAYTSAYFHRSNDKMNSQLSSIYSDYDSSFQSHSILYSHTYNSSHHSYESIDGGSNEHIYAEIRRKESIATVEDKPNDNEKNPLTDCKFHTVSQCHFL